MNKKLLLSAAVLGSMVCAQSVWAAPVISQADVNAANSIGADLNRTRDYLEKERVARQIAADRNNKTEKIQTSPEKQQEAPAVTFKLQKLVTDPSTVLTEAELKEITSAYEGKEVAIKDLYKAVADINALYAKKGYITCRAFLQGQTIKDGTVKITLIEGRTGNVNVVDNKSTKDKYITNRLHLPAGEPANVNELNKDLLRFNATNDAQLRIVMKAGEKPGTTDYVIQTYEPQLYNWNLFTDNAGSYSSGQYRVGAFFQDRSLSGNRDSLLLGGVMSKGSKAVSAGYTRSVGRSGAKLSASYNSNAVHTVRGSYVKGHSNAYGLAYRQPWIVNEKTRTEASLEYGHQNSKSDFMSGGTRFNIVDDTVDDLTVGFAMTNYGNSHILYHKHGYTMGRGKQEATMNTNSSDHYSFYKLDGLYQKVWKHGQGITMRGELQISANDNLLSSRKLYIGGMYSVRGYRENYLGGDSGFVASVEYNVPITRNRQTSAYTFFDYGKVYGEVAESANDERILYSTGIGIKSNITKNISANLALAFPLRKEFAGKAEEVSKTRLHFIVSGQF